jgi:thioredoxin-like negative regulator of GroEL
MRKRISSRRLFAIYVLAFGILALGDASIRDAVAQTESNSQPRLYFFTNDGCAPCRQVEPAIEALHREGYPVTTVKLSDYPQWGTSFQVDRTPTVVLVANQRIVGRHAGFIDGVTLKKWFATVGVTSGANFAGADGNKAAPGGTKVPITTPSTSGSKSTYTRGGDSSFSTRPERPASDWRFRRRFA